MQKLAVLLYRHGAAAWLAFYQQHVFNNDASISALQNAAACMQTAEPYMLPESVEHHDTVYAGNATAVAALILASMTLDVTQQDVVSAVIYNESLPQLQDGVAQDTTNTTAHAIAQAILTANLSSDIITQALSMAIAQSIEGVSVSADPAIIIEAAILVNQTQSVTPGFVMVTFFCLFKHACVLASCSNSLAKPDSDKFGA